MKKILILGGTSFIGRNLTEHLLSFKEYEVTLFNRQKSHSNLFPSLKKIKGDRGTDDIKQIGNQKWNYIIDLSCYFPKDLENVLKTVKVLDKYIFISTCSVYDNETDQSILKDEQSNILTCNPSQKTNKLPATYGNRKSECERIIIKSRIPYVILRPALVYGKYDPTDRLYFWLYQVKKKDTLLIPENGNRYFSTTYVLDLVEAITQSVILNGVLGVFNVVTKPKSCIKDIVETARKIIQSDFEIINSSANFLFKNQIAQWTDMPLWINGDHFTFSNQKLKEELRIKPNEFDYSIQKTIEYYESLNWPVPIYGLSEVTKIDLINKLSRLQTQNT